jgi:hypothetical protein
LHYILFPHSQTLQLYPTLSRTYAVTLHNTFLTLPPPTLVDRIDRVQPRPLPDHFLHHVPH